MTSERQSGNPDGLQPAPALQGAELDNFVRMVREKAQRAEEEKTARLRELRLARDASGKAAAGRGTGKPARRARRA